MSERRNTETKRPSYTPEFKAGAVRLIVEEGRAVSQVATELGVSQTALREWSIASKSTPERNLESGALTASEHATSCESPPGPPRGGVMIVVEKQSFVLVGDGDDNRLQYL